MRCKNCGQNVKSDYKYCPFCAARLVQEFQEHYEELSPPFTLPDLEGANDAAAQFYPDRPIGEIVPNEEIAVQEFEQGQPSYYVYRPERGMSQPQPGELHFEKQAKWQAAQEAFEQDLEQRTGSMPVDTPDASFTPPDEENVTIEDEQADFVPPPLEDEEELRTMRFQPRQTDFEPSEEEPFQESDDFIILEDFELPETNRPVQIDDDIVPFKVFGEDEEEQLYQPAQEFSFMVDEEAEPFAAPPVEEPSFPEDEDRQEFARPEPFASYSGQDVDFIPPIQKPPIIGEEAQWEKADTFRQQDTLYTSWDTGRSASEAASYEDDDLIVPMQFNETRREDKTEKESAPKDGAQLVGIGFKVSLTILIIAVSVLITFFIYRFIRNPDLLHDFSFSALLSDPVQSEPSSGSGSVELAERIVAPPMTSIPS